MWASVKTKDSWIPKVRANTGRGGGVSIARRIETTVADWRPEVAINRDLEAERWGDSEEGIVVNKHA